MKANAQDWSPAPQLRLQVLVLRLAVLLIVGFSAALRAVSSVAVATTTYNRLHPHTQRHLLFVAAPAFYNRFYPRHPLLVATPLFYIRFHPHIERHQLLMAVAAATDNQLYPYIERHLLYVAVPTFYNRFHPHIEQHIGRHRTTKAVSI